MDPRRQAAAGVDAGYAAFDHTTLVGQHNRLRVSPPAPSTATVRTLHRSRITLRIPSARLIAEGTEVGGMK